MAQGGRDGRDVSDYEGQGCSSHLLGWCVVLSRSGSEFPFAGGPHSFRSLASSYDATVVMVRSVLSILSLRAVGDVATSVQVARGAHTLSKKLGKDEGKGRSTAPLSQVPISSALPPAAPPQALPGDPDPNPLPPPPDPAPCPNPPGGPQLIPNDAAVGTYSFTCCIHPAPCPTPPHSPSPAPNASNAVCACPWRASTPLRRSALGVEHRRQPRPAREDHSVGEQAPSCVWTPATLVLASVKSGATTVPAGPLINLTPRRWHSFVSAVSDLIAFIQPAFGMYTPCQVLRYRNHQQSSIRSCFADRSGSLHRPGQERSLRLEVLWRRKVLHHRPRRLRVSHSLLPALDAVGTLTGYGEDVAVLYEAPGQKRLGLPGCAGLDGEGGGCVVRVLGAEHLQARMSSAQGSGDEHVS